MSSVNKAIIVGRLGKDPETRRLNDGSPVVSFSVATSETWKDKQSGERREKTTWHNVVIFNEGLCKVAEQYLTTGSQVYICGALQTRDWEKDGQKHYRTDIVLQKFRGELQMLDSKSDRQGQRNDEGNRQKPAENRDDDSDRQQNGNHPDIDDEIPF